MLRDRIKAIHGSLLNAPRSDKSVPGSLLNVPRSLFSDPRSFKSDSGSASPAALIAPPPAAAEANAFQLSAPEAQESTLPAAPIDRERQLPPLPRHDHPAPAREPEPLEPTAGEAQIRHRPDSRAGSPMLSSRETEPFRHPATREQQPNPDDGREGRGPPRAGVS
jgi:hypothetical protein